MKTCAKIEKTRIIKTKLYKYIQWVQMSNKVQTRDKQMWFISCTNINTSFNKSFF